MISDRDIKKHIYEYFYKYACMMNISGRYPIFIPIERGGMIIDSIKMSEVCLYYDIYQESSGGTTGVVLSRRVPLTIQREYYGDHLEIKKENGGDHPIYVYLLGRINFFKDTTPTDIINSYKDKVKKDIKDF